MEHGSWILLLFVTCYLFISGTCKECLQLSYCSCNMTDGSGTIDLTSLGGSGSNPRFQDVQGSADNNLYSYSPCGSFTEVGCVEVAACMISSDKALYTNIAESSNARFQFDYNTGNLLIGYFSKTEPLRLTEVEAICDASACTPEFMPIGSQGEGKLFKFQMKSVCACPGLCSTSGPKNACSGGSTSAISGGSVFLIVVVTVVFAYIVGGVAFMKFKKKASGTDLIPNKDLWKSIPSLVTGGFKFLLSKCSRK